jgi:exodeoxyribonuclease VII large subunit
VWPAQARAAWNRRCRPWLDPGVYNPGPGVASAARVAVASAAGGSVAPSSVVDEARRPVDTAAVSKRDQGMPLFDRLTKPTGPPARPASEPEPPATPSEPDVPLDEPGGRDMPLSVAAAVKLVATVLDRSIGVLWIEGECASLSRPASGHLYFTLKDDGAQLQAVLWRSDARRLRFRLEEGQRLLCRGRLGIYERDGKFQFYVTLAEPVGAGAEAIALEQRKQKLAAEGLFAAERKRPLPRIPRRLGVVTSRTGAAIGDIVRVVQRRFPVPILLAEAQVQGADAPRQIVAALAAIVRHGVDVVILGRGGGSASDLAAFNDEAVVRAVAACPVPTISAVGHEIDVTLTDLAADRRAATPSNAGELAVPVLADLDRALAKEEGRLRREVELRLGTGRQDLDRRVGELATALAATHGRRRRALAELERQLAARDPRAELGRQRGALRALEHRLAGRDPRMLLSHYRASLRATEERGAAAMRRARDRRSHGLAAAAGRLEALSPLRVLDRGYAIALVDGQVVARADEVAPGDELRLRLATGALDCRVERVHGSDSVEGDRAQRAPGSPDDDGST